MRWLLAVGLIWWTAGAMAAVTLPDALAKKIKGDPAAYLEDMAELIGGFGKDGAIGLKGLENMVALTRASARSRAMAKVLQADLDSDGTVSAAEMTVLQAAENAIERGKLAVIFAKADSDGDKVISTSEVQAYAGAAALAAFGEVKAQQLRGMMLFDANEDGRVSLDEVRAALVELGMV